MDPKVSVAFVPRETISQTVECLERLIAYTRQPYELIVVVAGYPSEIVSTIREKLRPVKGELVEFASYVTPNEARNAALERVSGDYIVFLDHDIYVGEDWLSPLVDCAWQTGAAIVSPLVFEREPLFTYLHLVGGEARIDPLPEGGNAYWEVHKHAQETVGSVGEPIKRHETGLAEFHTVLVDTAWLRSIGGLDPEILSMSEHWDMSVTAQRTGRTIYVEPASKVTYVPVKHVTAADVRWFTLRWCDEWADGTIARLEEKYGIRRDHPSLTGIHNFLKDHREYRYAPLRKSLHKRLGRSTSRRLMKYVLVPLFDYMSRRQLKKDLAVWRTQHEERIRTSHFRHQS